MSGSLQGFTSCPAPAKINLFLHVTGRRPDGYHTLQTAFRMLDHADMLHFRVRDDGVISRINDVPGVAQAQDLVIRAARLLQNRTGTSLGADVRVDKCLPMGGGLGGGSSDAATTLLALNRLWGLDVPRSQLQAWALELGADVPFFVFGRTAVAGGVGEALQQWDLPPAWYVVIEPPVSVPTAEIFGAEDLTRDSKAAIITGFPATRFAEMAQWVAETTRNDMQAVACRRYTVVQQALDALRKHEKTAGEARMSGSGACVFLPVESRGRAHMLVEELKGTWRVWCAASLDVHPLHDWAND